MFQPRQSGSIFNRVNDRDNHEYFMQLSAEFGSQESRILTLRKENLVADLYMGDKEASGKQGFQID